MNRKQLPAGAAAGILGVVVALAGSFSDALLGGAAVVGVLQLVLWIAGGILILAGAASLLTLRSGQPARGSHRGGSLRATRG